MGWKGECKLEGKMWLGLKNKKNGRMEGDAANWLPPGIPIIQKLILPIFISFLNGPNQNKRTASESEAKKRRVVLPQGKSTAAAKLLYELKRAMPEGKRQTERRFCVDVAIFKRGKQ